MVIRKVWLLKAPVSAGAGAVVQVPTQCWLSGISSPPVLRGVVGSANLMPESVPSPTQSAGAPTTLFLLFYQGRDQAVPAPTMTIPHRLNRCPHRDSMNMAIMRLSLSELPGIG